MNKKYIVSLVFVLLLCGCNKDPEEIVYLTPPDTMHVGVTPQEITLSEELNAEVAITFSWNQAAVRQELAPIKYYFKLDVADRKFATSIPKREIDPENLSISFTHQELFELITNHWKIKPGETVELEGEVIAYTESAVAYFKPELSKTRVLITTYVPKK